MIHVHTFSTGLKIFHSIEELKSLDEQVNAFLKENNIKNVISVSDTCTSDTTGATIGLIRVMAYEK